MTRYIVTGDMKHDDGYREPTRQRYAGRNAAINRARTLVKNEVFDSQVCRVIFKDGQEVQCLHSSPVKTAQKSSASRVATERRPTTE